MTLGRALHHGATMNAAEWRAIAAACALQWVLRALVATWPLDRVSAFTAFRPARRAPRIDAARLRQLVGWSTRLCGGTCLTESFVLRALSARAGVDLPVSVGVNRDGSALRAHAWAGESGGAAFQPLWRSAGSRSPRR